jgi:oligoendopeptidase F
MKNLSCFGASLALLLFAGQPSVSQTKDRETLDERYKWNLADLFPNDQAWETEKDRIIAQIPKLGTYKGTLKGSPEQIIECMNLLYDIDKELSRLYSYANMKSDQDTRVAKYQGMVQEAAQIYSRFSSESAFFEPEILQMSPDQIEKYIVKYDGLQSHAFYLRDVMRRKAHTLSQEEEKIIAEAGLMAGNAQDVYSIFSNAEFPSPEITLKDGSSVVLTKSNYTLHRASTVREDRAKVFEAFFGALGNYKGTFGAQLYGEVKKNIFYKNARGYNSCLDRALDANNIPKQVYMSLIENVNKNLDTFHRYLKLREKILGVEQLHYYDIYPPLLGDVEMEFSVEESMENIIAAMKPLGTEYGDVLGQAQNERWIDMYPTPGKRSGAYSSGSAYDVHPYILMNYNGQYEDLSTLAHELGHTMHSYLSNKHQPYPLADYSIFVAEVASTFNEALLSDYMLRNTADDKIKLSILGSWLEGIKGTLFRQTQFAEFELKIHELAEQGQALTGEKLDQIYLDLTRNYYGHDEGVCIVDDYIQSEWSYIPHFYYNFYVYQYATSFTASQAFSEQVLEGNKEITEKYLQFLSAGGSEYPIELLKQTGVDMTSSQPFDLTISKMNKVMDEVETILKRLSL